MNRKKMSLGGMESLISTGRDLFHNRISPVSNGISKAVRLKGKLGSTIAVITSLIVGFLTLPNNILYFINKSYGVGTACAAPSPSPSPPSSGRPEHEYAYIHGGIALIVFGCLAMSVSVVLSYLVVKSNKLKLLSAQGPLGESTRRPTTVLACLVMMNVQLFMAVIAGCMEMLYRPLIREADRSHNMEQAIAIFNVIIYLMYVVTTALTSTILRDKCDRPAYDVQRDLPDLATAVVAPEYARKDLNPFYSQSSYVKAM